MGVVYRATQLALDRPVALKAMAPQLAADPEFRERFESESHLAASIDHPNVIPVYEAGELDGTLYLIMRWVEGTDLRALLSAAGRLEAARAVRLLRPVASALAAAHRRGLVHRDVKPANVLITRGDDEDEHVYLTDFGIARRTDAEGLTRTGVLVGTIDYTAPERIEGGKGTSASDIYAFGCMLFETLTGHVPFNAPTDLLKMHAHLNDQVPSARAEVPAVPQQLDAIIAKAMAKSPDQRYASAAELVSALSGALEQIEAVLAASDRTQIPAVETETGAGSTATLPASPVVAPEPVSLADPLSAEQLPAPRRSTKSLEDQPGTRAAPPAPGLRRGLLLLSATLLAVFAVVVVLVAANGGGGKQASPRSSGATTSTPVQGSSGSELASASPGLTPRTTIDIGGSADGITADQAGNVWVSLADDGVVTRIDGGSGKRREFHVHGAPKLLAAGPRGVWVSGAGGASLELLDADTGMPLARASLASAPVALAADPNDGSVWAAEASGTIAHLNPSGDAAPGKARVSPAPNAMGIGEGWLWAVNGTRLFRVDPRATDPTRSFDVHAQPIAIAFDRGIWTAHAGGHVTRFNPQGAFLSVNTDSRVASELNAIAAVENGPFVWTTSASAKTAYELSTGEGAPTRAAARLSSAPVGLVVVGRSVWIATDDGKLTQISF
jgi:serine/threonine protein kinase